MNTTRPDASPEPALGQPAPEARASQPSGPAAADFSDSVGGLFAGPVSRLPDMPAETGEPPVRSLFALRGLFRL